MITVPVELGERRYDVRVGGFEPQAVADELARCLSGSTGVAVLVDGGLAQVSPRVEPLVGALQARLPQVKRLDLSPGESCKTLSEIEKTTQWLAEQGFDRGAALVGIGGGATGDHTGFAAAVYLRGVRFALCPTTLLAMVDASVGGKTAVDLPAGKNLVGAFHQPASVVADLNFLDSLPVRERLAGVAEVVKCGLIADAPLLALLEQNAPLLKRGDAEASPARHLALYEKVIAGAVRVKAEVVVGDERESGRRAILNFGHTVGHALESASGYDLLHGEAVALGMLAALTLGVKLGRTPVDLYQKTRRLLTALGLPTDLERRLSPAVLARIAVDKKRHGGQVKFILCSTAGDAEISPLPLPQVEELLLASPASEVS